MSDNLTKTTLAYLVKEGQILLAMKKRGFGEGKLNGIGGKVKETEGETIEQALIRESFEEIGIKPLTYEQKATLKFFFPEAPADKNWNQEVHVFLIHSWQGEPKESDEMKPLWLPIEKLPYDQMWSDDPHWLPHVISGKSVRGKFSFDAKGAVIDYKIKISTQG